MTIWLDELVPPDTVVTMPRAQACRGSRNRPGPPASAGICDVGVSWPNSLGDQTSPVPIGKLPATSAESLIVIVVAVGTAVTQVKRCRFVPAAWAMMIGMPGMNCVESSTVTVFDVAPVVVVP